MTLVQKEAFFEALLIESDYSKAKIRMDLVGISIPDDVDAWLKKYYDNVQTFDPVTLEAPNFDVPDMVIDALKDIAQSK